jgi:hypothetical protein
MIRGKMMDLRGASVAALSGGLVLAAAVSATAQQAATQQSPIMRFPHGVQFEIPQGWSWDMLVINSVRNSVKIAQDATRPQDNSQRNPNEFLVYFFRGGPWEEGAQ